MLNKARYKLNDKEIEFQDIPLVSKIGFMDIIAGRDTLKTFKYILDNVMINHTYDLDDFTLPEIIAITIEVKEFLQLTADKLPKLERIAN